MDLSKIKNLIKQNGDKFIFVENGEPEIVVMSFREYTKLSRSDSPRALVPEMYPTQDRILRHGYENIYEEAIPEAVSEEATETEFIPPPTQTGEARFRRQGFGASNVPIRLEDIRLEDLPI